jgi:hypothetical protein
MSESMFEISFSPGQEIVVKLRPPNVSMVKNETMKHLIGANREMLLALRSIIDVAIAKTDAATSHEAAPVPGFDKERIIVE